LKQGFQIGIFIVVDILLTFLSLGFYAPGFSFSIHVIYVKTFLVDNYHFTRSPFEFVLFLVGRTTILTVAGILLLHDKKNIIKKMTPVSVGFAIGSVSYSILKLLAFSEVKGLLDYPGLWFLLSWTWIVSPFFCVFWCLWLVDTTNDYTSFSNPDEEQTAQTATRPINGNRDTDGESAELIEPTEKFSTSNGFQRLYVFIRPDLRRFLGGIVLLLVQSAALVFVPFTIGEIVSNLLHTKGHKELFKWLGYMAGLAFTSTLFGGFGTAVFDHLSSLLGRRVQRDLVDALVKQESSFITSAKPGELESHLTTGCSSISHGVTRNVGMLFVNLFIMIGGVVVMAVLSWRLALVSLVTIPWITYITKSFNNYNDRLIESMKKEITSVNGAALEAVSYPRTNSGNGNQESHARYMSMLEGTATLAKKKAIAAAGKKWISEVAIVVIAVVVIGYGGHLVTTHRVSAEYFISYVVYLFVLRQNVMLILESLTGLMNSIGDSRRIFTLIDRSPRRPLITENGGIKFRDVSFADPSRPSTAALSGFSMTINAGESVALVGPSDGGKTSIVSLVKQLYQPDEGEITLDGVALKDYDQTQFHQKVAIVVPEPRIFDGTVRDNIACGCDGATEEMIIEAAKAANAHDFIIGLEKAYNTDCEEMTGGQKRRIAFARALIRKPIVLILDESSSGPEIESLVSEDLEWGTNSRTVLIVTDRLSTVEKANRIVVIDKGQVVQIGTHSKLMADRDGLYHNLVTRKISEAM
ncbi:hypothetical protein PFISCL1PPCAC_27621, partial [Pristionchus fissidentatus]